MVNIAQRPQEADDHAVPGHCERDLLIGRNNKTAIGTFVERSTGYALRVALPDGYKPEQVAPALRRRSRRCPTACVRSLTWDQGAEMRDWKQIRADDRERLGRAQRQKHPPDHIPAHAPTDVVVIHDAINISIAPSVKTAPSWTSWTPSVRGDLGRHMLRATYGDKPIAPIPGRPGRIARAPWALGACAELRGSRSARLRGPCPPALLAGDAPAALKLGRALRDALLIGDQPPHG